MLSFMQRGPGLIIFIEKIDSKNVMKWFHEWLWFELGANQKFDWKNLYDNELKILI